MGLSTNILLMHSSKYNRKSKSKVRDDDDDNNNNNSSRSNRSSRGSRRNNEYTYNNQFNQQSDGTIPLKAGDDEDDDDDNNNSSGHSHSGHSRQPRRSRQRRHSHSNVSNCGSNTGSASGSDHSRRSIAESIALFSSSFTGMNLSTASDHVNATIGGGGGSNSSSRRRRLTSSIRRGSADSEDLDRAILSASIEDDGFPLKTPTRTPPTLLRRLLLPGSWHGSGDSFSSIRSNSKHSRGSGGENNGGSGGGGMMIPGPPLTAPSPSVTSSPTSPGGSSKKKGLLSSSSPGKMKKLSPIIPLSPHSRKQRQSPNLLDRISGRGGSSHHRRTAGSAADSAAPAPPSAPSLYRMARKGQWEELAKALSSSSSSSSSDESTSIKEDVAFVYRKDGTTALHMAVMSRTGYLNNFKNTHKNNSSGHKSSSSFDVSIMVNYEEEDNNNSNDDDNDNGDNRDNGDDNFMKDSSIREAYKSSSPPPPGAPLDVIEELLKLYPDAAKLPCTLNGYTPLHYACLVCDETYSLTQAAAIIRLILDYCPESIHIRTTTPLSLLDNNSNNNNGKSDDIGGLTPVDIHIISYSAQHKNKEDESVLGQSSTIVLRTLLSNCPELANLRLVPANKNGTAKKVAGPIELLYKCNAASFTKGVMEELLKNKNSAEDFYDDTASTMSEMTLPERRQQVVDIVKKWWIWKWAVMILRYGSVSKKKHGSPFAAVHTAAMQVGCPTAIFSLALYAFPRQIKQPILDKNDLQNLPLHAICSWPCQHDNSINDDSNNNNNNSATGSGSNHSHSASAASSSTITSDAVVSIRKSNAITKALEEYPLAVKTFNARGESPLELALLSGTTWEGGVRRLVKAYPKALRFQSKNTRLYPFMTAAAAAAGPGAFSTSFNSSSSSLLSSSHSNYNSNNSPFASKRSSLSQRLSLSNHSRHNRHNNKSNHNSNSMSNNSSSHHSGNSSSSFPSQQQSSSSSSSSAKIMKQDLQHLRTIYGLLRSNPKVLTTAWQKN